MRITSIESKLLTEIRFLNAGRRPGGFHNDAVPVHRDYADTLALLLCHQPAITLLHDGPDVPSRGFRGSPRVREIFAQSESTLVVRGHSHWDEPLADLDCGSQVLNVDARVVILTENKN